MKKLLKITLSVVVSLILLVIAIPFLNYIYLWGLIKVVGASIETREERLDLEDRNFAEQTIKEFKNDLSAKGVNISLDKQKITLPEEYLSEHALVSKALSAIKKNDPNDIEYAVLKIYPFLLRNNDIKNAFSLYEYLKEDILKTEASSYLAQFYAQKGDCKSASTYIDFIDTELQNNSWIISRSKKLKQETRIGFDFIMEEFPFARSNYFYFSPKIFA